MKCEHVAIVCLKDNKFVCIRMLLTIILFLPTVTLVRLSLYVFMVSALPLSQGGKVKIV